MDRPVDPQKIPLSTQELPKGQTRRRRMTLLAVIVAIVFSALVFGAVAWRGRWRTSSAT